jgi:GH24 family phage-related lysozyme (muramidase)
VSTKQPIRLLDLFRYYKGLPHQMAALAELEAAMPASLLTRDNAWFKTWSQSGKQPDPAWLAPATKIIKDWEGLRLEAYKCAADVPTIGYGATRYPGKGPVRMGDTITASEAEALLRNDLLDRVAPNVFDLIPAAQKYGANQQAALISWAFNVGLGAVEDSTLRKRLAAGESARVVIPEELPRWNKANGAPLDGLTRRRAAEVALFMGAAPAAGFTPSSPFTYKITPHITYGEICVGEERRRFTSQAQCNICIELCQFIEKARTHFGGKPVTITSGHRPPAVNAAVGGASNSEHLYKPGCGAIDWFIEGVSVYTLQDWCIANWPYSTGKGAPRGFIHTGIRVGRPKVVWDY